MLHAFVLLLTPLLQGPASAAVQAQHASACEATPEVQLTPAVRSGKPGEPLEFVLSLTSPGGADCSAREWRVARQLPEGWEGRVEPETLRLDPGASGEARLVVTPARTAKPGSYGAAAVIWHDENPERLSHRSAIVMLEGEQCLRSAPSLALLPAAYHEGAGRTVPWQVVVANQDRRGCGPSVFALAGEVPDGWKAQISPELLHLEPGESASATLFVTAPRSARPGGHALAVAAADPSDPEHGAAASGVWQVTGRADNAPPSAPANLVARAQPEQVELSWQPAQDDVRVTGYRVLRDGAPVGTTNALRFRDRAASGRHRYAIVALDAAGNVSAPSNAVAVRIGSQASR